MVFARLGLSGQADRRFRQSAFLMIAGRASKTLKVWETLQGLVRALALRRTGHGSNDGVFYMLSDHLGSTAILVDQAGTVQSQ